MPLIAINKKVLKNLIVQTGDVDDLTTSAKMSSVKLDPYSEGFIKDAAEIDKYLVKVHHRGMGKDGGYSRTTANCFIENGRLFIPNDRPDVHFTFMNTYSYELRITDIKDSDLNSTSGLSIEFVTTKRMKNDIVV